MASRVFCAWFRSRLVFGSGSRSPSSGCWRGGVSFASLNLSFRVLGFRFSFDGAMHASAHALAPLFSGFRI